jgi:Meckelin (Transmembrane protein 67)
VQPAFWQRWTRDVSVREKADPVVAAQCMHVTRTACGCAQHFTELQLVCLEVSPMWTMDLALHNTLISAAVTWMMSAALAVIRRELGRRNLARCTLVDIRFLSYRHTCRCSWNAVSSAVCSFGLGGAAFCCVDTSGTGGLPPPWRPSRQHLSVETASVYIDSSKGSNPAIVCGVRRKELWSWLQAVGGSQG